MDGRLAALFALVLAAGALPVGIDGQAIEQTSDDAADRTPHAPPAGVVELDRRTQLPASHGFFVPYMETAALDVPPGIGPGSWVRMGEAYCTGAFVLEDDTGTQYLTTAAHCTSHVGQTAEVLENAVVAGIDEWDAFGTVVDRWPSYSGGWGGLDAALIEIDPGMHDRVDPSVPGWGGPTGVYTDAPGQDNPGIAHYGWGWATWYEHNTRCREGEDSHGWTDTTWWGESFGGGGDSGSAVLTEDGQALGILDWGRDVTPVAFGAFVSEELGGVRMDAVIDAFADDRSGLSLVEGEPLNPICMPDPPMPLAS